MTPPRVSVLIACKNVERFIDDAVISARRQTVADIEIVVVDDASTDATRRRLEVHAAADPRIRIVSGEGRGVSAARNLTLAQARGTWVAILDGDDMLHPRHLETLLRTAEETNATIVADNLLVFQSGTDRPEPRHHVEGEGWAEPRWLDLALFVRSNALAADIPALGYLKPMTRRAFIDHHAIRYDERLNIGEDYDFVAQALVAGATYRYVPEALYFYRKHARSTSHRMRRADLTALIETAALVERPDASPEVAAAAAERRRSLETMLAFTDLTVDLKAGRLGQATANVLRRPHLARLLGRAAREGVQRRLDALVRRTSGAHPSRAGGRAMFLTTSDTDMSRDLVALLAEQGFDIRRCDPGSLPGPAATLARDGGADVFVVDSPAALDCVPFFLSPRAAVIAIPPFPADDGSDRVDLAIGAVGHDLRASVMAAVERARSRQA